MERGGRGKSEEEREREKREKRKEDTTRRKPVINNVCVCMCVCVHGKKVNDMYYMNATLQKRRRRSGVGLSRNIHLFRGPCFICLYLCDSLYGPFPVIYP